MRARSLLKRAFFAASMLTVITIIGYGFSIRVTGLTDKPISITGGTTQLEGWSVVGAITIVVLLFAGMLHESRSS